MPNILFWISPWGWCSSHLPIKGDVRLQIREPIGSTSCTVNCVWKQHFPGWGSFLSPASSWVGYHSLCPEGKEAWTEVVQNFKKGHTMVPSWIPQGGWQMWLAPLPTVHESSIGCTQMDSQSCFWWTPGYLFRCALGSSRVPEQSSWIRGLGHHFTRHSRKDRTPTHTAHTFCAGHPLLSI